MEKEQDYLKKIIYCTRTIQSDFVTAFQKEFTPFQIQLRKLATDKYVIPYDVNKTILVHLRLDDRPQCTKELRRGLSVTFKRIIDHDVDYEMPKINGQSAMKENELREVIHKALARNPDCKFIVVTNGRHTLPYETLSNTDESYDLYLLCNARVLIGSISSFSFSAILFGNHTSVYYPIWDHGSMWGLTTRYDKSKICFF